MFAPLTVRGKGREASGKDWQEVRENLARGKEFPSRFALSSLRLPLTPLLFPHTYRFALTRTFALWAIHLIFS